MVTAVAPPQCWRNEQEDPILSSFGCQKECAVSEIRLLVDLENHREQEWILVDFSSVGSR